MLKLIFITLLQLSCLQDSTTVDTTKLTRVNVVNYLNKSNIKYKDIVYAQILIETNSFRSRLCQKRHNLFGMHYMYNRQTTALFKTKGYVTYSRWQSSIDDYYLFQSKLFKKHKYSKREYLKYLNRKFSQTCGYSMIINKITKSKHLNKLFERS